MATELLIRAGMLIDGTGAVPLHNVAVWVRDGVIQVVRDAAQAIPCVAPDVEVIDASHQTLLPGLIDTHVHLVFASGDDPLQDLLSGDDDRIRLRAAGNAQLALRAGITTVRDAGSPRTTVLGLRDAIRDGLLPGPRIVAAGMPITTTGGHFYYTGVEADSPDEVRKAARTLHRMGVDFFKVMATGGGGTPGTNVADAQFTVAELSALVEEADRLGKTVVAHAHGTAGIRNAVAAGVTSVEHCSWWGDGETEFDEAVAEEIVRKGIYVTPTAGVGILFERSRRPLSPARQAYIALQAARFALQRRQIAMGTKILSGTDAGTVQAPFDSVIQNLEVFVEHLGMTPAQAIQTATGLAAAAMHLDHEIGTVEPDKHADLIIVDGDPLANLGDLRRVRRVFRDGRTVVVKGQLCWR